LDTPWRYGNGGTYIVRGWLLGSRTDFANRPVLEKFLEKFPAADANGDGILTAAEACV
jgi:hypothetical protein